MSIEDRIDRGRWEKEKLLLEKQNFLREKLYSIHIFLSKTVLTLSSATLALSVGFKSLIKIEHLEFTSLILVGWALVLFAFILQMFMIRFGLEYYYSCYNNLISGKPEHSEEEEKYEGKVILSNRLSFWFWLIGTCLILTFIYINLIL